MDTNLDAALRRLGEQPVHPGLANLESNVLKRIAEERRADGLTKRSSVVAALGAVALGLASGGFSTAAATTHVPSLSPFGPSSPLAPATLLAFTP